MFIESAPGLSMGREVVSVELEEGATFGELLAGLEGRFGPELANELYDPRTQSLQELVRALVNGTLVHNFAGTDTVLHHGDAIIFVPLIMGG